MDEFIEHFGAKGPFLRHAFSRFFIDDLVAFFEELGVPTVVERGNHEKYSQGTSYIHSDLLCGRLRLSSAIAL
jgi:DNA repair exonuclease SbcCD nuclease subunit